MKKILLYGIDQNRAEVILKTAQSYTGNIHIVKNDELDTKVIDILEKESDFSFEASNKIKLELCMFAGFDRDSVFGFIDKLRATQIKRPVFATVTQNNLQWKFEKVLVDVNQEHLEMTKGK